MSPYVNGCTCERCRTRGFLGPALLVALGVLLLLGQFTRWEFGDTWPVLLIVIGVVKVLQSNASAAGHIGGYVAYPGYPLATSGTSVTPTTPPSAGNEGQVSHG